MDTHCYWQHPEFPSGGGTTANGLLQDGGTIYFCTCAHRRDNLDARKFTGFFDNDQHATRWLSLVAAEAMFLRGDVAPAQKLVALSLSRE